tara:strand:+ start:283 stop:384 length:102 start_codon:yes stop_codon:yes gene_type:complete
MESFDNEQTLDSFFSRGIGQGSVENYEFSYKLE